MSECDYSIIPDMNLHQCTDISDNIQAKNIIITAVAGKVSILIEPNLHLHSDHGRARFCLHWASFTLIKLVNFAETVSKFCSQIVQ